MKHCVVKKDRLNRTAAKAGLCPRIHHVDVILRSAEDTGSAETLFEFFRALNMLVESHRYEVSVRVQAADSAGGPLYWAGRTAVFWGDFEHAWTAKGAERNWAAQVLSLSPRSLLVGGAVMLLANSAASEGTVAAIHQRFEAAALENGIANCGAATHFVADGRIHSASTRLSALRLLSLFVSQDHGEYLADTLRQYIGLVEPTRKSESQVANRLVRRARGDQMVTLTVEQMLANIEDPLRISELSDLVGTSVRQLQRRFLCKTGAKPLETYKELRLERACSLLQFSEMTEVEIASATGFSSGAAMSRAFVKHYKFGPESVRMRRFLGTSHTLTDRQSPDPRSLPQ